MPGHRASGTNLAQPLSLRGRLLMRGFLWPCLSHNRSAALGGIFLAIDIVSVNGQTRLQRFAASEQLWKWIDTHETELGVGRPYLDRDPPHLAPIDGKEFAAKRGRTIVRKTGPDQATRRESIPRAQRLSQVRPARATTGDVVAPAAVYASGAKGW